MYRKIHTPVNPIYLSIHLSIYLRIFSYQSQVQLYVQIQYGRLTTTVHPIYLSIHPYKYLSIYPRSSCMSRFSMGGSPRQSTQSQQPMQVSFISVYYLIYNLSYPQIYMILPGGVLDKEEILTGKNLNYKFIAVYLITR